MNLTATEAKNRLGQVLEQAQRGPVVIESSGRRHSVVFSAAAYDALVAAAQSNAAGTRPRKGAKAIDPGHALNEKFKDWVDEQNARFEKYGLWNEAFRPW
jgi:prevent-host-death family protein